MVPGLPLEELTEQPGSYVDRNLNLTQRFYGLVATVVACYRRRIAFKNAAYD